MRFKMVARDLNSNPTQYRTWVVPNTPDYDGYYYSGPKSGASPLFNATAYAIADDNAIVDFNLPDPYDWSAVRITLPTSVSSSQLAVIDGYIYLFGGNDGYGNKILRATVDNPANWIDTGATLPDNLYGSQLAVIDDTIYLFGGNTGEATNHIYSAPVSNPLDWTDEGALLPYPVYNHHFYMLDGYLFIVGGRGDGQVYDKLIQADADNPLSWVDADIHLPDKIYSSTLAIIGDYICLFGGMLGDGYQTDRMYRAMTVSPAVWAAAPDKLPFATHGGQFAAVGNDGYMFTIGGPNPSYTRILRCRLTAPFGWLDEGYTLPGTVTESQLAIINDRLFLFGGNGSSVIYADNQIYKYSTQNPDAIVYGSMTRTLFQSAGPYNYFKTIGIGPWKTNYET